MGHFKIPCFSDVEEVWQSESSVLAVEFDRAFSIGAFLNGGVAQVIHVYEIEDIVIDLSDG